MTLHYHQTTVTPKELSDIRILTLYTLKTLNERGELTEYEQELLERGDLTLKWIGNVKHELWTTWKDLPDGDHLKEVYRDTTWTWDDTDIYLNREPTNDQPGAKDVPEVSLLEDQT